MSNHERILSMQSLIMIVQIMRNIILFIQLEWVEFGLLCGIVWTKASWKYSVLS